MTVEPRLEVDRVFNQLSESLTKADPERCVGALRLALTHSLTFGEQFLAHLAALERIAAEQFAPNPQRDAVIKGSIAKLADAKACLQETECRLADEKANRKVLEEYMRTLEARRTAIAEVEVRLAKVEAEIKRMSAESENLDREINELVCASGSTRIDKISRETNACRELHLALLERLATLLRASDQMLEELRLQVDDDAEIANALAVSPEGIGEDVTAILARAEEAQIAVTALEDSLKVAIGRAPQPFV